MDAIDVTQSAALAQDAALSAMVTNVTPWLLSEIDVPGAKAVWDEAADAKGRMVVTLQLKDDFGGEAQKDFAPDEFRPHYEQEFRQRLYAMKGAMIRVAEWRSKLNQLYQQVAIWVGNLRPAVVITAYDVSVEEGISGRYNVPGIEIRRGDRSIRVHPVAIWVVGAQGRVDIMGPADRRVLVLDQNNWFVVADDFRRHVVPLTEPTFQSIVDELFA